MRTGLAGGTTSGSVSSTSTMRSAQTSARGTIMNMNVAIMTDDENLHQVGQERGQLADLHAPAGHQVPAEPEHGDAGEVQHHHHGGEHQGHQPTDPERDVHQLGAGSSETLLLQVVADEGPDHPYAGDLLAQDPVDLVDPFLHQPETAVASGR